MMGTSHGSMHKKSHTATIHTNQWCHKGKKYIYKKKEEGNKEMMLKVGIYGDRMAAARRIKLVYTMQNKDTLRT